MEDLLIPGLILAALNNKTVDWIRIVLPDWVEGKILIPLSMAVGVLFALLFSQSDYAESIRAGDGVTLATANLFTVVIFGMASGAIGSQLNDFKPARTTVTTTSGGTTVVEKATTTEDVPPAT